jgi:hypothetical protein
LVLFQGFTLQTTDERWLTDGLSRDFETGFGKAIAGAEDLVAETTGGKALGKLLHGV